MIDDLVRFCLAEIAYEGELGCTIDRLKELIANFSEKQVANLHPETSAKEFTTSSSTITAVQQADANIEASTETGTTEPRQNVDEAYCGYVFSLIARHPSITIGTVPVGTPPVWIAPPPHKKDQAPPPISLDIIEHASDKTMQELKNTYGPTLRIAATKAACFVMITGTHSRPSKLSDVVYTTLQIITRARDKGVAIKDLGPITKYDPKAIFFQISQLIGLGLIVKVSKGPSMNWAVHKRFYDQSPFWQKLTAEEVIHEDENDIDASADLVANVSLLRLRVLRLLDQSVNKTHQQANLILAAGFEGPTKHQRRFFTSRVSEMVDEGLMDKIAAATPRGSVICLQLTDAGAEELRRLESSAREQRSGPLLDDCMQSADIDEREYEWTEENRFERQKGLQHQIIACLEKHPEGMIIKDLSTSLGLFDVRTIEKVLTRLSSRVPPRHLVHLHPVTIMETIGKMRRQRYYTLEHYQAVLQKQNLSDERYSWACMDDVGKFATFSEENFWKSPDDLSRFIEATQSGRKQAVKARVLTAKTSSRKKYKNPIINGVVKRGRPRKEWAHVKEGMADAEAKAESQTRTKKRKRSSPEVNGSAEDADPGGQAETNDAPSLLTLRRSKRKKTSGNEVHDEAVESSPGASKATLAPVEVAGEPANSEVSHLEAEAHSILDTAAAGPEPSLHGSTSGQESDVQVGASSVLESRVQLSPLATKVYIRKAQKRRKRAQNDGEGANKKRKVETASSMREQDGSIVQATPTTRDDHSEPFEGNNQDNHGQLPRVDPSLHTGRRAKLPKPKPTNYSQLKRHQELLDVLREKGGILHISGELSVIVQSHSKSLEDQGIEAAIKSTFLMDKKTIAKDVETMEQKGLVKVIKTVILDPNRRVSLQQPATIFYLPEVSQEEVQKFIAGLNQPYKPTVARTNSRQIVDAVPFTKIKRPGTGKKDTNAIPPLDGSKGLEPRHQFLEDRQTVAQLSGFLLGKCRRAQELHLFTLKDILSENPSHHILSVENRVVATDYWTEDFPLGSFCAIIPVYTYIPFLEHAQSHPDILNQPLKTFDLRLRRALKIKHASVRARFWELFTILAELQLVTPLDQHSDGTIVVEVNGAPKRLGATAMPTTKSLPLPQFWKFEENVPVWLLSLARFSSQMIVEVPPFHKMLSVSDTNSALVFWSFLQQICDRGSKFSSLQSISTTPDETRFLLSPATLACLCNLHAWTSEYRLSRLQEEFLNRMIDAAALTTPLDDPTPDRVVRASHVTCAPQRVICDYFASRMDKLKASLRRLEEKKQHAEMAQALIASKRDAFVQKAENHLVNLDRKWDALVLDVVGDDISEEVENQLQILRSRYITVGGMVDDERLKDLIRNTVHDPVESAKNRHHKQGGQRAAAQSTLRANQIHRTIPTPSMPRTEELSNFTPRTVPQQLETSEPTNVSHSLPPLLSDRYKHTIKELISNMGPALSEDSFKVTRGKRIKPVGQKSATRRKRFVWNADYDELLQDAVAVMRARCRGGGRGMLWGPLQAIFPTMHANNIRTHFIKHVSQPGLANYMDRLEQGWHDLWKTHKGRSELMEESPFKADSLHLAGHIQFLRDYLDKQNLPPASPQKATLTTEKVTTRLSLPKHVKDLSYQYHVTENESPSFETSTQNYWGDTSVYLHERHQAISNLAFTESGEKSSASTSTDLSLAQNVIQMIIATEPENYTELHATSLLRPFGDTVIKRATNHLSKRGVISKVSGTKPGRAYRMCDSNAEDLSGRLPLRRCEDAAAIEEVFEDDPDAWRVWSLNPNEGEMAALLQKVSSHEVEFKIQPPDLETINAIAKWNSRKIQDDMVEVEVAVLFDTMESVSEADEVDNASVKSSDNELVIEFDEDESGHGLSTTGETASCCHAQRTARHVNCEACLTKALKVAIETLPHDVSEVALDLMRELDRGGGEGVRAELVWNRPNSQEVVTALTNVYPPLAFWSGYSSCQLISANYWTEYAVWVYEDSNGIDQSARRLVIPRRWIDMNGRTDVPIWKAAQRAVVGQLITRPVIRHLHLIELLHKVYDRLDILAVLRYLERQSIVKRMCTESASQHKVGEMTTWEEEHTMWELNERLDWSEFV